jgi:hypothetical protein
MHVLCVRVCVNKKNFLLLLLFCVCVCVCTLYVNVYV